ncbi:MAG: hypothetical protein AB8F26_07875 [Phycisphaerales bacterium]
MADLTIRAGDSPLLDANGAGSVIKVNIGTGSVTLEGPAIQDGSRVATTTGVPASKSKMPGW